MDTAAVTRPPCRRGFGASDGLRSTPSGGALPIDVAVGIHPLERGGRALAGAPGA